MMDNNDISQILARKVLLLDGALGTEIQKRNLTEADFRGERFAEWPVQLKGNNDVLVLTRPDVITDIHRSYLEAGADIITTCTFNAQSISQAEYHMEDNVSEINYRGAALARKAADEYMAAHPGTRRYVAGSVGPTTKLLSMSDDADNPGARTVTFEQMTAAYRRQIAALIKGGADLLLIETCLDPINAKSAALAARQACEECGRSVPVMISATVTDANGHLLSGQSIEAFAIAVSHAHPLSIGLNCSLGAKDLLAPLRRLSACAPCCTSTHPNAGLPNQMGQYDDTPEVMTPVIQQYLDEGLVNIVGGCCGTGPEHIRAFRQAIDASGTPVRKAPAKPKALCLSGLEPLVARDVFVNVGERCNVAGSRKFLRLIKEKNYAEAIEIARKQVEDGAMVIDINMDDGLLDSKAEMSTFLNILSGEPDIAKVPVMVDSSKFDVITAGLEALQGKGIVNSISLKEGEEKFIEHARTILSLGSAVVVMAFDEEGQATSYQRRIDICSRAYHILVDQLGFDPTDIIFDPNILTVATGMDEHLDYAHDFVRATAWIKQNLPGSRVSGGLSNLSFAFRGNNYLREAMHAVFLYHAVQAGMDMAIMNPATALNYDSIDAELREAIEDALFDERTPESVEHLITVGAKYLEQKDQKTDTHAENAGLPVEKRLENALIKGNPANLQADLDEALAKYPNPVDIIAGPLMAGMNQVGTMFGEGRMFLPQVVKTARTMKVAVDILQPHIEAALKAGASAGGNMHAGKILLATVKGDVHDIGKNIVGVVLSCNNYETVDLGVMVPPEVIVKQAIDRHCDIVCLSGLITPSLDAMVETVKQMKQAGLRIPVMIGGAATSAMHTAVKIAPEYDGPVIFMPDASQNPLAAAKLLSPRRDGYITEVTALQERLRHKFEQKGEAQPADEIHRLLLDWTGYEPAKPPFTGSTRITLVPVSELRPLIDWTYFFHAWRTKAHTPEGESLRQDAEQLLDKLERDPNYGCLGLAGFFRARSEKDAINLYDVGTVITTRRQPIHDDGKPSLALCDFVHPVDDYAGLFATTVTPGLVHLLEETKQGNDDYQSLLLQTLLDRLAEAASEHLHRFYHWDNIRPAVGYPSLPDQTNIFAIDRLIHLEQIGISLTESGAMYPQASVAGMYISHPESRYFN